MRKNAVNRQLISINGGVCAVGGFSANAVRCGIAPINTPFYSETREDLGIIVSEKPVPTACVFTQSKMCGAPVTVTKKHIKNGLAQAIFVNSGVANVGGEFGEREAEKICSSLRKRLNISANEVVIASTGVITGRFSADKILENVDSLIDGLDSTENNSSAVARAMVTADFQEKEFAFSFMLGDYPCKIGGVCKGSVRVCPNMATTLCFLTTDVNVSPKILQKALSFSVNETLNMLRVDGISSPNDTVCIMANGKAGNYKIDCVDSEYKKFAYALTQVLTHVCTLLIKDGDNKNTPFTCSVFGAKSKNFARTVAKNLVGIGKRYIFDSENLLSAIAGLGEEFEWSKVEIYFQSTTGKLLLVDEGKKVAYTLDTEKRVIQGEKLELFVHFHAGNYKATAFGKILRE